MSRMEYGHLPEFEVDLSNYTPVPDEDVVFECGRCGTPLPLVQVMPVWHECATGSVEPVTTDEDES